jgi:hypothetical protein
MRPQPEEPGVKKVWPMVTHIVYNRRKIFTAQKGD